MKVSIYHNPRCSKSRQTKEILDDKQIDAEVIEYLKTPPSATQLDAILNMLDMQPRDLMRQGEAPYAENNLDNDKLSKDELIQAMIDNPILIQRPIVVVEEDGQSKAAIGRPPEDVLKLF